MSLNSAINAVEMTKNIGCMKGEGTVDGLKKFFSDFKNFNDHESSTTTDSRVVLQGIEANLASSKSIRQTMHFIIKYGSSPSQTW